MCESVFGNGNKNEIVNDGRVQVSETGMGYENASGSTKD